MVDPDERVGVGADMLAGSLALLAPRADKGLSITDLPGAIKAFIHGKDISSSLRLHAHVEAESGIALPSLETFFAKGDFLLPLTGIVLGRDDPGELIIRRLADFAVQEEDAGEYKGQHAESSSNRNDHVALRG